MNPVEIEVFNSIFRSVAEEMGTALMRAAFSPNIKERRDHSCAVFDAQGRLLAQAAHIPVHLGSMPLSVAAAIESMPMVPEESVILNDPFAGGTHLPDITLVTPVFVEGHAKASFFVANRAHHADVGGVTAGSLPLSQHIDDEGIRLVPQRLTDATIEAIMSASRTPQERRGDLEAQIAANRLGVRRLMELVGRHGLDTLTERAGELLAYAARLTESVVAAIPDGVYCASDVLDSDGFALRDIPITVEVRIEGSRCHIDFSKSADQVPGPLNAVRAITLSAAFYVIRCLGPEDMPTNAGCMAPIEVITRPGSIVDARYPAAVAAGNVETSQRTVDVLLRALAKALPDRVPAAATGSMNNVAIGGVGPRGPFVYYETIGGGVGAGNDCDGESGIHVHMTNTLNTPVEAFEHAYPMRIVAYELRSGSGGGGRHTGGEGIIREYAFDVPAEVTVIAERHRNGPYGLSGGEDGGLGGVWLVEDGHATRLPGKFTRVFQPGERLRVETAGGGGWGSATPQPTKT